HASAGLHPRCSACRDGDRDQEACMNCANHTDVSAVAYCRTCGKPLCAKCTRDVRGVIYCENCLAACMESVQLPGMLVVPVYVQPTPSQGGPNPALAGILAGFFLFGVGAVYTSQYAKE